MTKIHLEAFIHRTFLGLNCAPGLDGRARFGLGRKPRETRRQRQCPGTSLTGMDITMVCLILPRTGESWTSKRSASCLTALCSHDSECLGGVRHFMWGDIGGSESMPMPKFLGSASGMYGSQHPEAECQEPQQPWSRAEKLNPCLWQRYAAPIFDE